MLKYKMKIILIKGLRSLVTLNSHVYNIHSENCAEEITFFGNTVKF